MSDERTSIASAAPVHFVRSCDQPGCTKWGSFGRERGRLIIEWRCSEHLAADYWDGRRSKLND